MGPEGRCGGVPSIDAAAGPSGRAGHARGDDAAPPPPGARAMPEGSRLPGNRPDHPFVAPCRCSGLRCRCLPCGGCRHSGSVDELASTASSERSAMAGSGRIDPKSCGRSGQGVAGGARPEPRRCDHNHWRRAVEAGDREIPGRLQCPIYARRVPPCVMQAAPQCAATGCRRQAGRGAATGFRSADLSGASTCAWAAWLWPPPPPSSPWCGARQPWPDTGTPDRAHRCDLSWRCCCWPLCRCSCPCCIVVLMVPLRRV